MFGNVQVSPSILSADFLNLQRDVEMVERAGCDMLHVDVMDGHFVENLTIGPNHVRALKKVAGVPLDVHLMIANPEHQMDWYLEAGADICTFHIEASKDPAALIDYIHSHGAKAGVTLCPPTDIADILPFVGLADMVLVMSVNPGFSGQSFIETTPERVAAVVQRARELGVNPLIEVDGGINAQTAPLVVAQGADVLVAGNAVFKAQDPAAAVKTLKEITA